MNTTLPAVPRRNGTAMLRRIGAIAVAAAAVFGYQRIVNSAEPMRTVPAPTLDEHPAHRTTRPCRRRLLSGAYRACSST